MAIGPSTDEIIEETVTSEIIMIIFVKQKS